MADRTTIVFETDGVEGDERLVREYVLPAMERLPESDTCEDVGFLRYGDAPDSEVGEVRLYLRGDVEAIVSDESPRWDALVEDDLAGEWVDDGPEDDTETFGDRGGEAVADLQFLASRMSKVVFESSVADDLEPVDSYPGEGPVPVGWWTLLHFLADQRALSADEEIAAYVEGIRNRLWTIGLSDGEGRANERIDELVAELDAVRDEVAAMADEEP